MQNLFDVGYMARLLLVEQYADIAYTNLALDSCVAEVLGFHMSKELSGSDWKPQENGMDVDITPAQIDCVWFLTRSAFKTLTDR